VKGQRGIIEAAPLEVPTKSNWIPSTERKKAEEAWKAAWLEVFGDPLKNAIEKWKDEMSIRAMRQVLGIDAPSKDIPLKPVATPGGRLPRFGDLDALARPTGCSTRRSPRGSSRRGTPGVLPGGPAIRWS
jgi:hypothetical protein